MNFDGEMPKEKLRDRDQHTGGYRDNYLSYRARIGVLVPSTNTAVEYDLQKVIPRGVTWHVARFMINNTDLSSDKSFVNFLDDLRETIGSAIESLLTCRPDHVLMGMSAETFWGGVDGNDGFVDRVQQKVGSEIKLTTGANSVAAALDALHVLAHTNKKLAIITPYQPIGDKNVRLFFEESGYEVGKIHGLRCENAHDAIALVSEVEVADVIHAVDGGDIDAIIQVGTNLSTSNVFPTFEKMLQKPMISINTATIWHALRSCGVIDQFDNMGRLLEAH
jgi:maleate isomerase